MNEHVERTLRLVTRRQLIASVSEQWKHQYFHNGAWSPVVMHGSAQQIYERLDALDHATATPEDVARIIGNDGWTSIRCSSCNRKVDAAVEIGSGDDGDSVPSLACHPCLAAALELLS